MLQTGFEFRKMRAIPVVFGVVVASEHEEMVLDAWREEEVHRAEKEATKKQKEVLARWKKFLVGLRIRKRIGIVYGDTTQQVETEN
jgi:xeroderma pigmentosum group C-complementing protein